MTTASGNPRLDGKVKVLKALAHPARLLMAEELERGERCVCELQALVGLDMSTVSKHLSILKGSGIVFSEKRGLSVYYQLRIPCILKVFGCIESVLENNLQEQLAIINKSTEQ